MALEVVHKSFQQYLYNVNLKFLKIRAHHLQDILFPLM